MILFTNDSLDCIGVIVKLGNIIITKTKINILYEYMIVEWLNLFNKKIKCFADFVGKTPAALVKADDVLTATLQTNKSHS